MGLLDILIGMRQFGPEPCFAIIRTWGPDESGLWYGKQVGLGHRKLSIIDPFNGRQPFFSEDRKIVIVYNGEIYNFRDAEGGIGK